MSEEMKLGVLYENLNRLNSPIQVVSSRTGKVLLRRMLPQHLSIYRDVTVCATQLQMYLSPDKEYAMPIAVCYVWDFEFEEAKLEAGRKRND